MAKPKKLNKKTKTAKIYSRIRESILDGQFGYGQRIPSEVDLARDFSVSRPTVSKAIAELEREHIVARKVGSGTYVRFKRQEKKALKLGLLVAGLTETEIFNVICSQIADMAHENDYTLIWNSVPTDLTDEDRAKFESLADRCIEQKVTGVFFVPLRKKHDSDRINVRITKKLSKAGIAVVLIDRDSVLFPRRSRYDMIGIDNFLAGYEVTQHLLKTGARHISYLSWPQYPNTVKLRWAGYQNALYDAGITARNEWVHIGSGEDVDFVKQVLSDDRADAYICDNDTYAAQLMRTLNDLGVSIPTDVRIAAYDDISYAMHLRVPLTTYRQPCQEIGRVAVDTMLLRIREPDQPVKNIQLPGKLIVRTSTQA